jgi:CRP-like cAMP-binding protein
MEDTKDQSANRPGKSVKCDPKLILKALSSQPEETNSSQGKPHDQNLAGAGAVTTDALHKAILHQQLDRLAGSNIFSELDPRELAELRQWASKVVISGDREFIAQDTEGECLYVLLSGRLKVYRKGAYGEEILLAYVEPGESIGEMGFFTNGYRSASVKTLSESQLLKIKYEDLQKVFDQVPTLARNFLGLMAERLHRTDFQLEEIAISKELTERSLKGLSKLMDTSQIMTVRAGIEGLIQRVVTVASEVMDSERASLFLLDHENEELWSKVAMGMGTKEIRIPLGEGWPAGQHSTTKRSILKMPTKIPGSMNPWTGKRDFKPERFCALPSGTSWGSPSALFRSLTKK